jgi:ribosomal protein L37AE/L43A
VCSVATNGASGAATIWPSHVKCPCYRDVQALTAAIWLYPMSKDINESGSTELSLQHQTTSLQPRVIICPKCQHKRTPNDPGPDWQCPNCSVAYNKASTPSATVAHKVNSASGARGRTEIDRDELETATPSAISLSLLGRVGRLRYLAYSWPTIVLSGLLMLLALSPGSLNRTLTIFLVILACVLWMCVPLRLMALRKKRQVAAGVDSLTRCVLRAG